MYKVNVYFGCRVSHVCGEEFKTAHSLVLDDPDHIVEGRDAAALGELIAGLLGTTSEDGGYSFNLVRMELPESVVEKIQKDAVSEYKKQEEAGWFGDVRWCDDDIRNELDLLDVDITDENVERVRNLCSKHWFTDRMIEAGWEALEDAVRSCFCNTDGEEAGRDGE